MRRLVNIANLRLMNMERSKMNNSSLAYNAVKRKVFDEDKAYRTTYIAEGETAMPRFRTDIGSMNKKELMHLEKEVKTFLNAKTSTIGGMKGAWGNAKETLEKQLGQKISDTMYASFYKDELIKHMIDMYGSDKTNQLMLKCDEQGLNTEDINTILQRLNFTVDTKEQEIGLRTIQNGFANFFTSPEAFDNYVNSKEVVGDLFDFDITDTMEFSALDIADLFE